MVGDYTALITCTSKRAQMSPWYGTALVSFQKDSGLKLRDCSWQGIFELRSLVYLHFFTNIANSDS